MEGGRAMFNEGSTYRVKLRHFALRYKQDGYMDKSWFNILTDLDDVSLER